MKKRFKQRPPKNGTLKYICANQHRFPCGKSGWIIKCPLCGAEIIGFQETMRIEVDTKDWVGIVGSVGK